MTGLTKISYPSHNIMVDEVAALAASQGEGALLAKIDIESAYWLIPVHPNDHPLQAMRWQGRVYVDPMLPFGLCSAPKVCWYLHQVGIPITCHYLDDYIIVAPPPPPPPAALQCQENLDTLDRVCRELGVPKAAHKRPLASPFWESQWIRWQANCGFPSLGGGREALCSQVGGEAAEELF